MPVTAFHFSLERYNHREPLVIRKFMIAIDEVPFTKHRFDDSYSPHDRVIPVTCPNRNRDKPMPGPGFDKIHKGMFVILVGLS